MVKTAYGCPSAQAYDDNRFSGVSGRAIHSIELGLVRDALSFVPASSRVLEIGCGTARILLEVCRAGYRVDGLDASPYMLAECEAKIGGAYPGTGLLLGEAARIPCLENSYDFAYAVRVLNQTESADYALNVVAEMIRIVRPGGYVLVEFMNWHRRGLEAKHVRLGPNVAVERDNKENVRLRWADVVRVAQRYGGDCVWRKGAFLFGMTTLHLLPSPLVKPVSMIDQWFSRLVPGWCSRCYALLRKPGSVR